MIFRYDSVMNSTQVMTLQEVPLFSGLTPDQMRTIAATIKQKSFKKGEILFFDGKPCDQIVIVRSGRVKILRTASTGREQILEVLNSGDTCACHSGASPWCCSSSSQALTDCEVWILSREKYGSILKTNLQMTSSLNEILAGRLQKLSGLIEKVSLDDPRRRIAKFIFDLSSIDENSQFDSPVNELPFTHEEVANRLGLVRETVTRHLSHLKRAQLIDLKPRKIIILDRKGLAALLV